MNQDQSQATAQLKTTADRRPRSFSKRFITTICKRLREGKRVRRVLPQWGRLHIDRQLPFLCVYRRPKDEDPGTSDLVMGAASYLMASGEQRLHDGLSKLVVEIATVKEALKRHPGGGVSGEARAALDQAHDLLVRVVAGIVGGRGVAVRTAADDVASMSRRDDAFLRADDDCQRAAAQNSGYQLRQQLFRSGGTGECNNRTRPPTDAVEYWRRDAGRDGPGDARIAGKIFLLFRRERGRQPMGTLSRAPGV